MSDAAGGRRVVVTGLGAVTPLGSGVPTFWRRLVAGESGVRRITQFDPADVASQIAGEVPDLDASGVLDRKELRRNDRTTQMALVATREALDDAGLPGRLEGTLAEQTGILMGSGLGGSGTLVEQIGNVDASGPGSTQPVLHPHGHRQHARRAWRASRSERLGPNFSTTSACASSGHAIGEACEIIRRGDADVMVGGGCEAPRVRGHRGRLRGHACALDPQRRSGRRQPAVRCRTGRLRRRRGRRGAHPRGARRTPAPVVRTSTPRSAATAPRPMGTTSRHRRPVAPGPCARLGGRCRRPDLEADRIDLVSAHATSTGEGDPAELIGINTLVGDHARNVSVTATKSSIGHTLGAAGAVAAVATVKALVEGVVPPTLNLVDPDERAGELDLTRPAGAPSRPRRGAAQLLRVRWPERGHHPAPLGQLMEHRQQVAELVALVDRLESLLERSALSELEVEVGQTTVILRTPAAIAQGTETASPSPSERPRGRGSRQCRRKRSSRASRTPSWRP